MWLADQGWTRVDPTAAVSPERVSLGLSLALADEQSALANDYFNFSTFSHLAIIAKLKLQIEAIDYQWTRLVVGYSMDKQSKLLKELLGSGKLWKTALIFVCSLLLVIGVLYLLNQRTTKPKGQEKWQREFDKLLNLLNKRGHVRQSGQTIKSFLQALEKQLKHKEEKSPVFG